MTPGRRPALLCTDTVIERHGGRLASAAPQLELVALSGDDLVGDEDLTRLDVAFFSGDAYPERTAHFFGACINAPNLRWLHTYSAGTDHPIFQRFLADGVRVSTSSGASAPYIARTVLLYLLALSRDLPGYLRDQTAHSWMPRRFDDVEGQTIGVVGMGPIGRAIVDVSTAVGMDPIGMRRRVLGDEPCETWPLTRLGELASTVDVLAVALPLTDDTRGLVSSDVIAGMRPGALFLNVGRGEVVDERALVAALVDGHLGGAGLDVFATEPLPDDSPLWDLSNVIVTPHSSGFTSASDERAVEIFVANLAAYTGGDPLRNEVPGTV